MKRGLCLAGLGRLASCDPGVFQAIFTSLSWPCTGQSIKGVTEALGPCGLQQEPEWGTAGWRGFEADWDLGQLGCVYLNVQGLVGPGGQATCTTSGFGGLQDWGADPGLPPALMGDGAEGKSPAPGPWLECTPSPLLPS